jgi:hypothetical protein
MISTKIPPKVITVERLTAEIEAGLPLTARRMAEIPGGSYGSLSVGKDEKGDRGAASAHAVSSGSAVSSVTPTSKTFKNTNPRVNDKAASVDEQPGFDSFRAARRSALVESQRKPQLQPVSWVKVGVVAKHLGINSATIRKWAIDGLIRSLNIGKGKHRLIDLKDAEAFMREHITVPK